MDREYIISLLKNNDKALTRAIIALAERQTEDERAEGLTRHQNGMGFRPCHAAIGVSMANFATKTGFLTRKQIEYWRKENEKGVQRIEIYAGQLLKIAIEKQTKS